MGEGRGWGRGAIFSGSFPRALAKFIGANHLKIFFFNFVTKNKGQKRKKKSHEEAASMRKPLQENL